MLHNVSYTKNELVSYHKVRIKPCTGCLNAAVSVNRNNDTNSSYNVVSDLYRKKLHDRQKKTVTLY